MTDSTIYAVDRDSSYIDRLYQIIHLAKVGAASTDTALNLEHMDDSQCVLFEVIHRLASEGVDMAEKQQP